MSPPNEFTEAQKVRSNRASSFTIAVSALFFVCLGCQRYVPYIPSDTYTYNRTQEQLYRELGKPFSSWAKLEKHHSEDVSFRDYVPFAEETSGAEVYYADIFWVPRTSLGGIYWDYVAYNEEKRIVHFKRRFLD